MRTPASIAGHPIHVMAVSVPIGLWIFSLVCDLILIFGRNPDLWFTVGYIAMAGGIVLGIIESFSSYWFGPEHAVTLSFALLLVLLFVRPSGLLGRRGYQ